MSRLFGTDGVRGIANRELTNGIAYYLGQAAVEFLGKKIVIGKDTRLSGNMLEAAMVAGITSAGGTALRAGIIPTPGIAFLVRDLSCDGGVVISASHNPPEYNGIKLFDNQGFKLPDQVEDQIQAFIEGGGLEGQMREAAAAHLPAPEMPFGAELGTSETLDDACERYVRHVVSQIFAQGMDFGGVTIALDVGHGASAFTSPEAFRRLGADVVTINEDFNGCDINVNCGSTYLEPLRQLMEKTHADIGVAHDGDADRVMLMTPDGTVIDGDMIEAVCALDMKARGKLSQDTIVSTVMCNLGLVKAMEANGIATVQTKVGDRYVLEAMREQGYSIGGEQSGHMILLEHNSTGDGLMTACQFIAAVKRKGDGLDGALSVMTKYPQVLINVVVKDKYAVGELPEVKEAVQQAERELGDRGRVLLRPSGTEPLIRVMVEAQTIELAKKYADELVRVVENISA